MILKHFNIKIWWYLRKLFSEHFGSVAYTILGNVEFCHIWITNVFKYIPLVFVMSMFPMQNLANLQIRLIYRFPWHLTQVLLIKASYQLISYIILLNKLCATDKKGGPWIHVHGINTSCSGSFVMKMLFSTLYLDYACVFFPPIVYKVPLKIDINYWSF